jgi:hypothetical protein
MGNYIPENFKDIYRLFQTVAQGDSIADVTKFLAGPPTDPAFTIFGRNLGFEDEYSPIGYPIQTLADENRTAFILIKNSAKLKVSFDVTDFSYNGSLLWLLGLNDTNFNPKAGFWSRKPGSTEYFKSFYGIIPDQVTLTIPDDNKPLRITADLISCKPIAESTSGPTIGGGSYASAVSTTPLLPTDASVDGFLLNSVAYKTKGMSITVKHVYAALDPDESYYVEHMTPVQRLITGSVNIFKKQGADAPHADIFAKTVRSMSRVLYPYTNPTHGTRVDLTNVLLDETDKDNYSAPKSETVMKNYNFTAGGFALTDLTS